jgi:phosphate:Na+ symporter
LTLGANIGTAINPVLEGGTHDPASRRVPIGNLLTRISGLRWSWRRIRRFRR